MATSNHDRVGRALHLLKVGLGRFVDRTVKHQRVSPATLQKLVDPRLLDRPVTRWDVPALIKLMLGMWNDVFCKTLGPERHSLGDLRSHLQELRSHRNRWAHQEPFSNDDAYRAIDTAHRLLTAVSAEQAREVERLKTDLLRVRFEMGARSRGGTGAAAGATAGRLTTSTDEQWRQTLEAARLRRRSMDLAAPQDKHGSGPRTNNADKAGPIIRYGSAVHGSQREPVPRAGPEYPCPIPGCTKVFYGTRGGWDAHVASWRMHPHWHPDVTDGEERKRRFKREYPRW